MPAIFALLVALLPLAQGAAAIGAATTPKHPAWSRRQLQGSPSCDSMPADCEQCLPFSCCADDTSCTSTTGLSCSESPLNCGHCIPYSGCSPSCDSMPADCEQCLPFSCCADDTSCTSTTGLSCSESPLNYGHCIPYSGCSVSPPSSDGGGCGGGCIGGIIGGCFVPVLLLILWMSNVFAPKCPPPCPWRKKDPPPEVTMTNIVTTTNMSPF